MKIQYSQRNEFLKNEQMENKHLSFCTAKEAIKKKKRQPTNWKKIFANNVTDQGLISKIYKQFI